MHSVPFLNIYGITAVLGVVLVFSLAGMLLAVASGLIQSVVHHLTLAASIVIISINIRTGQSFTSSPVFWIYLTYANNLGSSSSSR